ncbi:pyruvate kinase [Candidatus Woesearchaeota archaeon]|nr:pyruvate kinase [Candidatus Woesearchaeota archaeon]
MNDIVKTKIVCTIGPGTESVSKIKQLYEAGMSVARINCSHGDHDQYRRFIKNIRTVSNDIAIMLDTQGPEIRIGSVEAGTVLKNGSAFTLTTRKVIGNNNEASVSYKGLPSDCRKGDKILIDSGFLELNVLRTTKTDVVCKVVSGGPLGNQKGVNHPGCLAKMPAFTAKDRDDVSFGITHGIDFIAASFVRSANDIKKIKEFLNSNHHIKVIAKIENEVAVGNVDSIIDAADGVMVARGDLGVELPMEKVPLLQKEIIRKCNLAGKPVVTATQMLESMVNNPRPTRAEAGDVANAILDGTDAIMLSEETAIGKYPVQAVETMVRIARNTESAGVVHRKMAVSNTDDAIADAVFDICELTEINKIVVATCSGYSARLMSKYRPHADIIAVTPADAVVRQMGLSWGVEPVILREQVSSTRDLVYYSILNAFKEGLLNKTEKVVCTAAHPFNIRGRTNLLEIHTVGELLKRGPSAR